MKKLTLSVVALLAMGAVAVAETFDAYGSGSYQNSVAPKPIADYTAPAPYIGIAYTYISGSDDFIVNRVPGSADISADAVTINAGYDFNQFIAAEIRYTGTMNDVNFNSLNTGKGLSNIAGYIKPQYRNGTGTLYGLLGYGKVTFGEGDDNAFQWGVGFSFDFENSTSLYFDYIRMYDDATTYSIGAVPVYENLTLDTFTFGISYRF
jgi:hypothetical protein